MDDRQLQRLRHNYVGFATEVLGVELWSKQKEILQMLANHPRVAIRSGFDVGKTFTAAVGALSFLYLNPPSKVITTAPTARQVFSILWSEINTRFYNAKFPLGGECLTTQLKIDSDWFAIGFTAEKYNQEAFQGYHAENLLLIFDEAPGVHSTIWAAAEGLMASKNAKFLAIGNPISSTDDFGRCFKSPFWQKIHISCFDSPNIIGEKEIAGLVTQKWIDERKEDWGEDSPLWQSRVLGNFPEDVEGTLISLSKMQEAVAKEVEPTGKSYKGVDIARYGEDSTVIIDISDNNVIKAVEELKKQDTMAVAGKIVATNRELKADAIGIDIIGIGGGVYDRLREQGLPVIAVNVAEASRDKTKFASLRDELWWDMRELFVKGEISIQDKGRLVADLSDIRYSFTSKGQIKVESKEDMRRRGKRSPDFADALAIALYTKRQTAIKDFPLSSIACAGKRDF